MKKLILSLLPIFYALLGQAQSWNVEVKQSDTDYTIVFSFTTDGEKKPTAFEWNPGDSIAVVYGPVSGTTLSTTFQNGKFTKSLETKYTVIACNKYPGTVTIPPACITYNGRQYYSDKKSISSSYIYSQVSQPQTGHSDAPKKVSSSGKREDGTKGQAFSLQWYPAVVKAITGWCYDTETDKWSGNANFIYYKKITDAPSLVSKSCMSLSLGKLNYFGDSYYVLKWGDHWRGNYFLLLSPEQYAYFKNVPSNGLALRLRSSLQLKNVTSSDTIVRSLFGEYCESINMAIKKEEGVIRFQMGNDDWHFENGQLEFPVESNSNHWQGYFEVSISEWKRLFQ